MCRGVGSARILTGTLLRRAAALPSANPVERSIDHYNSMAPPSSTMLRGALLSGEVREKHARSDDCDAKWFAEDEKIVVSTDNEAGGGCQSARKDGIIITI